MRFGRARINPKIPFPRSRASPKACVCSLKPRLGSARRNWRWRPSRHAAKTAATSTVSFSTVAESLTNVYRAARLAFSPTLLTAGSLAAGFALEKTGEAAYGAAGTIRRQSIVSGLNKVPISPDQVSDLSYAGGEKNLDSYLNLYNESGGKNLRNIAEQLSAIKDPAEQARAALTLFGSDAENALRLLNQEFVENSDRVKDWGLSYSGETRDQLLQFREDIDSLKSPFTSLADTVQSAGEKIKATLVALFAGGYSKLRDGSLIGDALAPFNLDRWLPKGSGDAGSALSGFFATEGASFRNGKLGSLFGTADEQFATEFQRNLGQNQKYQANLHSGKGDATGIEAWTSPSSTIRKTRKLFARSWRPSGLPARVFTHLLHAWR